jgi:hypothetical protein
MAAGGYESWFVSARDPASQRALWIRHTRLRPGHGLESAALWCTVAGRDFGDRPVVVKQVFDEFPACTTAGAEHFSGSAVMRGQTASWDLHMTGGQPLRPLRPAALYGAPLPRTKLEATVPDALVNGTVEAGAAVVSVSGWRGTVGHNWGSEHADTWVWLHADRFDTAPAGWLDLALARVRVGPVLSPWIAIGAIGLGGKRILLGGLGRRPQVDARPGGLNATIPSAVARLQLAVSTDEADAVAVPYADPSGGIRSVRHAAIAAFRLSVHRRGADPVSLSGASGAYEYGTSADLPGTALAELPEG